MDLKTARHAPSAWLKLAPVVCASLACSVSPVENPGQDPDTGVTGMGGATSAGGNTSVGGSAGVAGGGGLGGVGADDCPSQAVARTPLRRLTRFEYENTVRDLLKVDTSPVADLPADEVTNGFDNNAGVLTVSSLHAEKYVLVSEALAALAVQKLPELTGCDPAVTGEEACARQFAQSFGRRAFRRPLTAGDEEALMTAYAAGFDGGSYAEGIEVMIRAALQSPHFLYRLELAGDLDAAGPLVPLTPFELATRLSYLLWASGPDDALLDAAAAGQLETKEQVAAKAREMLASSNALVAYSNFFRQWSSLSRLDITTKNTSLFPAFNGDVQAAMARELPAFLDYLINQGDRTLQTLLTANLAFVTEPLAPIYGVAAPPGSESTPQLVELPGHQGRAGLLTQAGFLSVQAHPDQTSPVLRGKFVRSRLLCDPPDPPPDDVDVSLPEVDAGATARERFSAHLSAGSVCSGCHAMMDPIGLTFEHFDAMGQYRETEGGQAIDVSGEVVSAGDPALEGPFVGVQELASKLGDSELVRGCVATQLFRFAAGRSEAPADSCSMYTLQETFDASGGDLVELLVGMTQTDAFFYRSPVVL